MYPNIFSHFSQLSCLAMLDILSIKLILINPVISAISFILVISLICHLCHVNYLISFVLLLVISVKNLLRIKVVHQHTSRLQGLFYFILEYTPANMYFLILAYEPTNIYFFILAYEHTNKEIISEPLIAQFSQRQDHSKFWMTLINVYYFFHMSLLVVDLEPWTINLSLGFYSPMWDHHTSSKTI